MLMPLQAMKQELEKPPEWRQRPFKHGFPDTLASSPVALLSEVAESLVAASIAPEPEGAPNNVLGSTELQLGNRLHARINYSSPISLQ